MILKQLYDQWDEWSLRQMTPKREHILLERWRKLSALGYARFSMWFFGGSLLVSVLFVLMDRRLWGSYPPGVDPNAMARIETCFDLAMTAIFLVAGLMGSLIFYFSSKMWATKIANWKLAGRL